MGLLLLYECSAGGCSAVCIVVVCSKFDELRPLTDQPEQVAFVWEAGSNPESGTCQKVRGSGQWIPEQLIF